VNTEFFGLQIYNHINWKNCIEEIIPKFSAACDAIRSMVWFSNINTLKSIYYAYFHSVIKYGIIFWGNFSNNGKISTLQQKIIRTMAGAQSRTSCRSLFKQYVNEKFHWHHRESNPRPSACSTGPQLTMPPRVPYGCMYVVIFNVYCKM
jgi:hypothetical protein